MTTGFADINGAKIYFEAEGAGQPFVMIHAGVADNRQWNNEFSYYAQHFRAIRYDMRGYGQSEPVDGEYTNLGDLVALLDYLNVTTPIIIMGCSMGGGLAMDFTLEYPDRVQGLIMVASGPSGLEIDVPEPAKYKEAIQAFEANDLYRVAEIETQIWFDGEARTPDQVVDPTMRQLLYAMNLIALQHEVKELGKRLPNRSVSAVNQLDQITVPVLVIVGEYDTQFTLAAADYMADHLPNVQKVVINNTAHLPNMEHPDKFAHLVDDFLASLD